VEDIKHENDLSKCNENRNRMEYTMACQPNKSSTHVFVKTGIDSYKRGYDDGQKDGYLQGEERGYIDGRDKGDEEGFEEGYQKGYVSGLFTGVIIGSVAAFMGACMITVSHRK
jgi:flagellar biosynthesis/type III secretory pathway protein FliH